MLTLCKNKKGVSVIVAYVLLITIGLSMSVLVFNWLKFQAEPAKDIKCPDEVSLVIEEIVYSCDPNSLIIDIRNRGFFTFDGYSVRVNDDADGQIGIYKIYEAVEEVQPGDEISIGPEVFPSEVNGHLLGDLSVVEVQPFIDDEDLGRIHCENYALQKVSC